jgi:hypothetical protein
MVNLICDICSKTFERKQYKITRAEKHYCSNDCRYKGQESSRHKPLIKNGVVNLETTKGIIAVFDSIDIDLAEKNWYSQNGYVIRKDKQRNYVYMHQVILERMLGRSLNGNEEPDHINGNRSDNRRDNLRLLSHSENCFNIMKPEKNESSRKSTSMYKGVNFYASRGRYRARITIRGVTINIGYFDNERDAAIAYDKDAIFHFREKAKLNFPDESYAWEIHKKNGCAYKVEA